MIDSINDSARSQTELLVGFAKRAVEVARMADVWGLNSFFDIAITGSGVRALTRVVGDARALAESLCQPGQDPHAEAFITDAHRHVTYTVGDVAVGALVDLHVIPGRGEPWPNEIHGAREMCRAGGRTKLVTCTRVEGHDGPHVAQGGRDQVVFAWASVAEAVA